MKTSEAKDTQAKPVLKTSPDGRLVEASELSDRPFFLGVQYHPEFKSRPTKAHPLFYGFVEASLAQSKGEK